MFYKDYNLVQMKSVTFLLLLLLTRVETNLKCRSPFFSSHHCCFSSRLLVGFISSFSTRAPHQQVVKTVGQSPGGLPLIAAAPNAQYFNAVFSSNRSNGNGGGAMLPLPPLTDGSGNMSGSGTPSLVLVNNSKTHSNHTPSPTVMIGSNGDVTAAVAI